MNDVLGQAISDYYYKRSTARLWVHNQLSLAPASRGSSIKAVRPKELMPVDTYFRGADDMPELEWVAMRNCKGKILDIGAGAGSHALFLQRTGLNVTALEISPLAASVMKHRGIRNILCQDFFTLAARKKYDTLLLMMNGIGLSGTLDGLREFLRKARTLLRPGGRLIFDSCDVAYLYGGKPPKGSPYYGEVCYRYEYRRKHGDWFYWLFIDRRTLSHIAGEEGWKVKLLFADRSNQYLVECTLE